MNEINPDGVFPGSASEQGICCERLVADIGESGPSASSEQMVCKQPPTSVCSNNNRSLCILEELNKIYEERLVDIDQQADGSYELKYLTYKEWVEMLLKLMRDLIDVVQELEYEASTRIDLLEKKLQLENGSTCSGSDVLKIRSDVNNLVELIRRALQGGSWNLDGLNFNTVKPQDIFGTKLELSDSSSAQTCNLDSPRVTDIKKLNSQLLCKNHEIKKLESEKHMLYTEVQRKDLAISNYANRIRDLEKAMKSPKDRKKSLSIVQEDSLTGTEEDEVFKVCISELKDCLRKKELQLAEKLKENECLQTELHVYRTQAAQKDKAVANMRALAFEVADKHDQIILLRDQVNSLEEELKKAHKKVQFKDNVIRELRREIKNSTKNEYTTRSCQCFTERKGESDTENKSFKSVTFNENDNTQQSDYTMNSAIDTEMSKLGSSARDEEDRCIKTLKEELEGLLMFQSYHNETIEEEKRALATQHARLREIVHKMLTDLTKNRRKLFFMQTRLLEIIGRNDTSISSRVYPKQVDSGYISPEDMEAECHLIDRVKFQMNEIKAENDSLKEQIRKSTTDMMSRHSSDCNKCESSGNSEKILQEVARTLSKMCGKEIPLDASKSIKDSEVQVHPICEAMLSLENELNEKNRTICNSESMLAAKDREINNLQQQLTKLEQDINNKNFQVEELEKIVDVHLTAIDRLNYAKEIQETEIASLKRKPEEDDYKTLLDAKQKLEIECQNQLTTINNLREALESSKKSGNSSNSHQSGHSPPVTCSDIGHDVLSDQLLEMFNESMGLERRLLTIRDENLSLKELLVDSECDFRILNKKYQIISKQLNPKSLKEEFQRLNERSQRLQQEIQLRGGEQLYRNCFRHVRANMEKDFERRFKNQESKYREIINDLTNDLNSLSTQVQDTQKQFDEEELANFDASFQELEAQNEALQRTIESQEAKITDLENSLGKAQTENRQLIAQTTLTENLAQDKDAKYQHLSDQYQILAQSIHAMNSRCTCGASHIIQPVLPQIQRISSYLAMNKEDSAEILDKDGAARYTVGEFQPDERIIEMQVQIDLLERTLEKRDQELREANARLLYYAEQNGELTSELYTAQDQIFYLQAEDERLRNAMESMKLEMTELRSNRREREHSLISELNHLRQSMDQHVRVMSKNNDTISSLERQTQEYRRQGDLANRENALLKAEIFSLRESLATKEGTEKSLRSQVTQMDKEMMLVKVDLERYKNLTQDIENLKKHYGRLKEANYDLVKKYNEVIEEYNTLAEEYRKLIQIKDYLNAEVKISRAWKKEQLEQDKLVAAKFAKLEEHINLLVEDRKTLIQKVSELHRDTIIINSELDQYRDMCMGMMDEQKSRSMDSLNDQNPEFLIRKMQRITRKMAQTRKIWEHGMRQPND